MLHSEVKHFFQFGATRSLWTTIMFLFLVSPTAGIRLMKTENTTNSSRSSTNHPSILATLISESRSNMTKRNLIYGVVISPLITKGKSMLRQIVFTEREMGNWIVRFAFYFSFSKEFFALASTRFLSYHQMPDRLQFHSHLSH